MLPRATLPPVPNADLEVFLAGDTGATYRRGVAIQRPHALAVNQGQCIRALIQGRAKLHQPRLRLLALRDVPDRHHHDPSAARAHRHPAHLAREGCPVLFVRYRLRGGGSRHVRNHVIQNGREFLCCIPASDDLVGVQHEQFVKLAAKLPACGFVGVDDAQGLAVNQQRRVAADVESVGKPLLPSLSLRRTGILRSPRAGIHFAPSCPGVLRGSVKKNLVPTPGFDSTQMRPPWRSTIFLQIARPIPVPPYSSRVCRR